MTRRLTPSHGSSETTQGATRPVVIGAPRLPWHADLANILERFEVPVVSSSTASSLRYWLATLTPSVVLIDLDAEWGLAAGEAAARQGLTVFGRSDDEVVRARALRSGFVEAAAKSIAVEELALRIRALQRHDIRPPVGPSREATGSLWLDHMKRTATWDGERIELSVGTFDLLKYLADRAGSFVPKDQLMTDFQWIDDNALHQAVWQLRRSLGPLAAMHVVNSRRYGYGYFATIPKHPSVERVQLVSS